MQRVLCKLKKFVPNFWYRNNIATGKSTGQIKAASGLHCIYKKKIALVYPYVKKARETKKKYYNKIVFDYLDLFRTGLHYIPKFKDINHYIFNIC